MREALRKQGALALNDAAEVAALDQDMEASRETFQARVESKLNDGLESHSEVWRARPQMRGHVINFVLKPRNTVFRISASSPRPIVTERYQRNWQALEEIEQLARAHDVRLLLFLPPFRGDVPRPVIPR